MIVVDTSVWIDFLLGADSPYRHALHGLIRDRRGEVAIAEVVVTEVLQGIRGAQAFHATRQRLLAFPIYRPTGVETYIEAARIYRGCRSKGKTVRGTIDCIIAAICIEHGLTLLHKDRDFDLIQECTALKCYKV